MNLIFRQEGWRLEHERPEDTTSPIVLKGIVYNEMKGVFVSIYNINTYIHFVRIRVCRKTAPNPGVS